MFLRECVENNVARMMAGKLQFGPKTSIEAEATIKVLADILGERGLRNHDAGRVDHAVITWMISNSKWPTPADIINCLPSRREYLHLQHNPSVGLLENRNE